MWKRLYQGLTGLGEVNEDRIPVQDFTETKEDETKTPETNEDESDNGESVIEYYDQSDEVESEEDELHRVSGENELNEDEVEQEGVVLLDAEEDNSQSVADERNDESWHESEHDESSDADDENSSSSQSKSKPNIIQRSGTKVTIRRPPSNPPTRSPSSSEQSEESENNLYTVEEVTEIINHVLKSKRKTTSSPVVASSSSKQSKRAKRSTSQAESSATMAGRKKREKFTKENLSMDRFNGYKSYCSYRSKLVQNIDAFRLKLNAEEDATTRQLKTIGTLIVRDHSHHQYGYALFEITPFTLRVNVEKFYRITLNTADELKTFYRQLNVFCTNNYSTYGLFDFGKLSDHWTRFLGTSHGDVQDAIESSNTIEKISDIIIERLTERMKNYSLAEVLEATKRYERLLPLGWKVEGRLFRPFAFNYTSKWHKETFEELDYNPKHIWCTGLTSFGSRFAPLKDFPLIEGNRSAILSTYFPPDVVPEELQGFKEQFDIDQDDIRFNDLGMVFKQPGYYTPAHFDVHVSPHIVITHQVHGTSIWLLFPPVLGLKIKQMFDAKQSLCHIWEELDNYKCEPPLYNKIVLAAGETIITMPYCVHLVLVPESLESYTRREKYSVAVALEGVITGVESIYADNNMPDCNISQDVTVGPEGYRLQSREESED